MKKILVTGGTGAMGVYLIPELLKMGYEVDVISLDSMESNDKKLRYIKADAKDLIYISKILKNGYDAVVDFMVYQTAEQYESFVPLYLKNTKHYIFLSTYRVYADCEHPIKETSPRLLDVTTDEILLNSGDYCIYKAQSEDYLRNSEFDNWTIIRPAITYSKRRFQLVTLEMDIVMRRMLENKKIAIPKDALNVQATMSWAGDVAVMIARLLFNEKALREIYSVCTSEHHTWKEVADIYNKIGGLSYEVVDTETYLNIIAPDSIHAKQQLVYDRCFDRIMDNSKILEVTGMKQSDLTSLAEGLKREYDAFQRDFNWPNSDAYDRMDEYFNNIEIE